MLEDDVKQLDDDVKQLEAFNKKHYTNLNTSNEEILNSKLSVMDYSKLNFIEKIIKILFDRV